MKFLIAYSIIGLLFFLHSWIFLKVPTKTLIGNFLIDIFFWPLLAFALIVTGDYKNYGKNVRRN